MVGLTLGSSGLGLSNPRSLGLSLAGTAAHMKKFEESFVEESGVSSPQIYMRNKAGCLQV
jgi:hypothetical protein